MYYKAMKHVLFQMRAKDIVVLLGLLARGDRSFNVSAFSSELAMSRPEVHQSLKRCQISRLFDPLTQRPRRAALEEFIIHGVSYVFPATPGAVCQGVATAHSAPPLSEHIVASPEDKYVWAFKDGKDRGRSIVPLFSTVPQVAIEWSALHELLALVDALRVGRVREREFAKKELSDRIRSL